METTARTTLRNVSCRTSATPFPRRIFFSPRRAVPRGRHPGIIGPLPEARDQASPTPSSNASVLRTRRHPCAAPREQRAIPRILLAPQPWGARATSAAVFPVPGSAIAHGPAEPGPHRAIHRTSLRAEAEEGPLARLVLDLDVSGTRAARRSRDRISRCDAAPRYDVESKVRRRAGHWYWTMAGRRRDGHRRAAGSPCLLPERGSSFRLRARPIAGTCARTEGTRPFCRLASGISAARRPRSLGSR